MSPQQGGPDSQRRAERVQLFMQPAAVLVLLVVTMVWVYTRDLNDNERRPLRAAAMADYLVRHVELTVVVMLAVVLVGVPLGVLATRSFARLLAPVVLALANFGQSAPVLGVLVLSFLFTGLTGFWIAVFPLALYSVLPVLSGTMLGMREVDRSLIDAATGIGMSPLTVLRRVELPLAVPYILAGIRTSLVLAVGTATLAFLIGGGGLGLLIDTGYKLQRPPVLIAGAVLAISLALVIDWLGALATRWLGPKGLR